MGSKSDKINAYIVAYGWYDSNLIHGVFTDIKEAERIKEHLQILFPEYADKYYIEGLKLNTFYSWHLREREKYNHGKGQ